MSDYLSRAAERANPPVLNVRPALPSLFEAAPSITTTGPARTEQRRRPAEEPREESSISARKNIEAILEIASRVSARAPITPAQPVDDIRDARPLRSIGGISHEPAKPEIPQPQSVSPNPPPPIKSAATEVAAKHIPAIGTATSPTRILPIAIAPRVEKREMNRNATRAFNARTAAPESEPARTIHVTIGRIEVRAVQPPPAARPEGPRSPRISLDEYLNSRNAGAA
jgi:hypothetical protein